MISSHIRLLRRCISVSSLLALNLALAAQPEKPRSVDALAIFPQACYLSGTYQQTKTLPGLPGTVESHGDFIFSCDKGLIWHTALPVRDTLVYAIDGRQYKILQGAVTQPLNDAVHRHLNRLLNGLIGADAEYLQRHFDLRPQENGIELFPKRRRMKRFLDSISLRQREAMVHLLLNQSDAARTEITLSDVTDHAQLGLSSCIMQFEHHTQACHALFE